jgi:hypothetical protein
MAAELCKSSGSQSDLFNEFVHNRSFPLSPATAGR